MTPRERAWFALQPDEAALLRWLQQATAADWRLAEKATRDKAREVEAKFAAVVAHLEGEVCNDE